jgi:carotenoid cleavage dioxygenase-like enzyme
MWQHSGHRYFSKATSGVHQASPDGCFVTMVRQQPSQLGHCCISELKALMAFGMLLWLFGARQRRDSNKFAPNWIHDISVTPNYAIIVEPPLAWNMLSLMLGSEWSLRISGRDAEMLDRAGEWNAPWPSSSRVCTHQVLSSHLHTPTCVPSPCCLHVLRPLPIRRAASREYLFMDWVPEQRTKVHVVALDGSKVRC